MLGNFSCFCCHLQTSLKNYFKNTIRVSNSLEPDQARYSVWPDQGPNWLQRLSVDEKSHQQQAMNIRIYNKCEGRIEKSVPQDHRLSSLGIHPEDRHLSTSGDP